MRAATRLRILYFLEVLLLIAALVAGSFPGLIALITVVDGMNTTFSRLQLLLSMATGGLVMVVLLVGAALAGRPPVKRRALQTHAAIALLLLLPSAIAAVPKMGEKFSGPYFELSIPLGLLFVVLPLLPVAALKIAQGHEEPPTRALVMVGLGCLMGVLLNLGFGLWAFVEIGTWV